ncbi:hypothetical protein D9M71_814290 [compost metagenome]
MLDAVSFEDVTHFPEANPIDGGHQIDMDEAYTFVTSLSSGLYTVAECKRADLSRAKWVHVTREREVRRQQFYILIAHLNLLIRSYCVLGSCTTKGRIQYRQSAWQLPNSRSAKLQRKNRNRSAVT